MEVVLVRKSRAELLVLIVFKLVVLVGIINRGNNYDKALLENPYILFSIEVDFTSKSR